MTDSLKHRFSLHQTAPTHGNSTTVQQLLDSCSKAHHFSVAKNVWLLKTHLLSAP